MDAALSAFFDHFPELRLVTHGSAACIIDKPSERINDCGA
jgi:hypothetical protein